MRIGTLEYRVQDRPAICKHLDPPYNAKHNAVVPHALPDLSRDLLGSLETVLC